MPSLEKRISALEVETVSSDHLTIIRRGAGPGQMLPELHALVDGAGNKWKRQPGETEQGFIDRASDEASRSPWGVALLLDCGNC